MATDSQQVQDFDHILHHMLYLTGMSDAYTIINKQKKAEKQKPLYCQPDTEILNGADYMRILQKALDSPNNSIADQLSTAEAMLLALEKEFPCQ